MPTGKDIKRTSSQVMELKDLISGPLAATIDADSIATRRYLSYLMELAFESYDKETGKVGELRMLEFNYQSHDVDGTHQQQVKIPLLTLVPLPLLQVKEADFDFDIQIVDALSADTDATFSLKNGAIPQEKTAEGGQATSFNGFRKSRRLTQEQFTTIAYCQHESEGKDGTG